MGFYSALVGPSGPWTEINQRQNGDSEGEIRIQRCFQASPLPIAGKWILRVENGERDETALVYGVRHGVVPGVCRHLGTMVGPQSDRTIESCAILTTESRGVTRQIHHRMPLLVAPEQFEGWLDGASEAPPDPTSFTWGHPISARPVSLIVNSPTVDEPACLNPDSGEGITEQLF